MKVEIISREGPVWIGELAALPMQSDVIMIDGAPYYSCFCEFVLSRPNHVSVYRVKVVKGFSPPESLT